LGAVDCVVDGSADPYVVERRDAGVEELGDLGHPIRGAQLGWVALGKVSEDVLREA
jgi:hypothetical protein